MGKKSKSYRLPEEHLHVPPHTSYSSDSPRIVDTHTHLLSTFALYREKYPEGRFQTVHEFVRGFYRPNAPSPETKHEVEAVVDVWCEAPVTKTCKELADSALTKGQREKDWGGLEYWFVMGVHPHEAKHYTDAVEQEIIEAMAHPRCVGWGETGLDYHYMNSEREVQKRVFRRQLRCAVKLGKPLTIHTREADEDVEQILKEEVPKDHKIHIHCFTDSPVLAQKLLEYFPNLCIGITGVITFVTNTNTADVVRAFSSTPERPQSLRILLETDAPYMTPANIYPSLTLPKSNARLPFSHSGMIPWTAEFVANSAGQDWNTDNVLRAGRDNAKLVYGV